MPMGKWLNDRTNKNAQLVLDDIIASKRDDVK
jgi:hypothetical protein